MALFLFDVDPSSLPEGCYEAFLKTPVGIRVVLCELADWAKEGCPQHPVFSIGHRICHNVGRYLLTLGDYTPTAMVNWKLEYLMSWAGFSRGHPLPFELDNKRDEKGEYYENPNRLRFLDMVVMMSKMYYNDEMKRLEGGKNDV
ncbi:hypothetical protein AVT15_gp001 [Pseudomonas phage vB_PaeM_PS24]|uniref:Uncharacterized protein n=1 Tax=Pseudomonas phage vB_PaeM_PS24 TaxID=1542092 RepID=A0A0K0L9B2_9CAUD|nr:hypothetical protein AVT15_gp001 [Pseudomonas phage vB_PaeM_PS24]AIW01706.1 hypothetical protein vB_PaeM_PS2400001 [Pseudomonas phage vB_PaeM_PS24]